MADVESLSPKRVTKKAAEPKDKSRETWIWNAACSIRGAKDAPKYKDYILPLIFTKRLCDVFDDEFDRIARTRIARTRIDRKETDKALRKILKQPGV